MGAPDAAGGGGTPARPYVLVSCALSIDGHIDDAAPERLVLSSAPDLDRIDELRAGCDAILVGAGTIRADDPRLVLRSAARRTARAARGLTPDPAKVTLTRSGDLDPRAEFFIAGGGAKYVYTAAVAVPDLRARLAGTIEVIDAGGALDLATILTDLAERGVCRLLVEGGSSVFTQFLAGGFADELSLVVAPFFVGDRGAPRMVTGGEFPWTSGRPARLTELSRIGDLAVLRYALSPRYPGRSRLAGG